MFSEMTPQPELFDPSPELPTIKHNLFGVTQGAVASKVSNLSEMIVISRDLKAYQDIKCDKSNQGKLTPTK